MKKYAIIPLVPIKPYFQQSRIELFKYQRLQFYAGKNVQEKLQRFTRNECVKMIREQLGPVAAYKKTIVLKRLPKTRSGKVLRGTMRKIADQEEFNLPPTIDDPLILDEIKESLLTAGVLG